MRYESAYVRCPVLARSQSNAARTWRMETQAKRDTAAVCLALRIRENAPSTWRFSTRRIFPVLTRSPWIVMYIWCVRLGLSGAWRRTASHCVFAIFVPARRVLPGLARSPSIAARTWRVGTQVERDVAVDCLALRIRQIGPSTQRFSCQRLECPLIWRTLRQKRRVLGAWGPTPSGVRPWTASHCTFA